MGSFFCLLSLPDRNLETSMRFHSIPFHGARLASNGTPRGALGREREGFILALQALMPEHLGIDIQQVCDNLGRIVDGWTGPTYSLCTDGDLLMLLMLWLLMGRSGGRTRWLNEPVRL